MKRSQFIILLVILTFTGVAHGVGFQRVSAPDPEDKPIDVGIWYPSNDSEPELNNTPFQQALSLNAKPAGTGLPVVILSHGYGGWMGGHANTAKTLAEAGFVAVALTHTGNNYEDESYPLSRWLLDRPRHVSRAIDYMHENWPHRHILDTASTAAFGFSAGGYTVMALAGAVPDVITVAEYCSNHPDDFACKIGLKDTLASDSFRALSNADWGLDKRISAAVAIAPGLGFGYNKAGLENVQIPLQIWSAEFDTQVPDKHNGRVVEALLPDAPDYHFVKNAGHYAFLKPCNPLLEQANPKLWEKICVDAEGFDRLQLHAEINRNVIKFFRNHLNQ